MNPSNLDGIDMLQIISISLALLLGFLPNVISMKSSNGKITNFGYGMIILFSISVITALSATVAKSSSDKDDYKNLFDSTNATLYKSNQNIIKSDSILNLQSNSVDKLKNLQTDAIYILQNEVLLVNKSDSIQEKSRQLNEKLAEEIVLQKSITKIADSIVKKLELEREGTERYNQLRLILCFVSLRFTKCILYDGLQVVDLNLNTILKKIQNEYNSNLLKLPKHNYSLDSLQDSTKQFGLNLSKYADLMNNFVQIHIGNLEKNMAYSLLDTTVLTNSIKVFFEKNLSLLDEQISNPILQKNRLLLDIWNRYYNDLYIKRSLYYFDKSTLNSIEKIKLLLAVQDEFLLKVQKNIKLDVILEK